MRQPTETYVEDRLSTSSVLRSMAQDVAAIQLAVLRLEERMARLGDTTDAINESLDTRD